MLRAQFPAAFLAASCWFASGVSLGQENTGQAGPGLDFSRVAGEATRAGWEAYDTGNVAAIERLASNMTRLACERDNDRSSCEPLRDFENGTAPVFSEGRTAVAGALVIGTVVMGDRYSSCLIKKAQESVVASCFVIGPSEGMKRIEPGRSISGALAEFVGDPTSWLHAQIMDGFEKREFFPVEYSARRASYHFRGGYRLDRKIPTILRQHNDRLFAATIMFVNRPGMADSYPTLRLSVMRMPSAK